jgi:hypothetical protein
MIIGSEEHMSALPRYINTANDFRIHRSPMRTKELNKLRFHLSELLLLGGGTGP